MNKDSDGGGMACGLCLGVAISVVTLIPPVYYITRDGWREDCIKRGYAEYSQATGQWQWKETLKKAETQP